MIDVVCAIIVRERRVLVTQRSESMQLPLKWEFPGGKIEESESELESIHREIMEELSIEIEITSSLTQSISYYGSTTIRLIPYLAKFISGQIILAEHKDYSWKTKDQLRDLDWAVADIPIVDELLKAEHNATWTL